MKPLIAITAAELDAEPSARVWALVQYLATHAAARRDPALRPFWLAYSYDAEVLNGGHLQYFHNHGTGCVAETLDALRAIGAHGHAAVLEECRAQAERSPVARVDSLGAYASLAAEGPFAAQDAAYHDEAPPVMQRLESHHAALLAAAVAVRG
ncbi:DMP19 family protein [Coralloluteibacterium thermophilus]|uniref:DUF4375 domain-containing protein n=1 Tax=Coralloluteibacterium thermophilum TaxID=2707049 RepID=A0ABV9NJN7_9GAMM